MNSVKINFFFLLYLIYFSFLFSFKSGHLICFIKSVEAGTVLEKELEHKGTMETWLRENREDGVR